MVLSVQKVPLQGFSIVPAESALDVYCNVEVDSVRGEGKMVDTKFLKRMK